jgi:hypothetical protein
MTEPAELSVAVLPDGVPSVQTFLDESLLGPVNRRGSLTACRDEEREDDQDPHTPSLSVGAS